MPRSRIWTGIMVLLLVSISVSTFRVCPVKAATTIYIRADGNIDPSDASISTMDNVTYTFTSNIVGSIVVERNDTIIDGEEYALQGTGANESRGIDLTRRTNVTVQNTRISNFTYGIWLELCSDSRIIGNSITANKNIGILLRSSWSNGISGNSVTANGGYGVALYASSDNNIVENNLASNHGGFFSQYSPRNSIAENNIAANSGVGICFYSSLSSSVSGNNITANNQNGIEMYSYSRYNSISENDIADSYCGIRLSFSPNNSISINNITDNDYGVIIHYSDDNKFYHNRFIDNIQQVGIFSYVNDDNVWDSGYGGNYWSDYIGTDSDGDGIGDIPCFIDDENIDRYPLMNPYWIQTDINHDLKVDILDVVMICRAFGTTTSTPNWNPHPDITEPYGKIDIFDIVLCTSHYGEEYL